MSETKVKPVVDIKEASLGPFWGSGPEVLYGLVVNHPRSELNEKPLFHSSRVVRVDGDTVETLNTVYNVISWRNNDHAS